MAEIEPTANPQPADAQPVTPPAPKPPAPPRPRPFYAQAVADAAGEARVSFTVPTNENWSFQRIRTKSTSVLVSVVEFFRDIETDTASEDSGPGNDNLADNAQPLYFTAGSSLLVVWTGCTVGAVCTARCQVLAEKL